MIIKPDNTVIIISDTDPATPIPLEELQKGVGGYIDILGLPQEFTGTDRPVDMVLNDNGKIEGLPLNPLATLVAHVSHVIGLDDYIAGDVMIVACNDEGESLRLTDDERDAFVVFLEALRMIALAYATDTAEQAQEQD